MSHPIAEDALDNIDVMSVIKDDSVSLSIIITGRLEADEETKRRLFEKINNYLTYINSEEFMEEHGQPDSSRIEIKISLKKEPSKEILEIIEQIKPRVKSWNARLTYAVS
ncbi:MAG: hypothetical protein K2X02_08450 [Alphaproteobacteria bacterium]|nr:hypothetical protein [Alphaproteobacteria bacterium]